MTSTVLLTDLRKNVKNLNIVSCAHICFRQLSIEGVEMLLRKKPAGQTRYLYMVALANNVAMCQLRQAGSSAWALECLSATSQAWMVVLRRTLSQALV